jgi:hypothetical protein
VFFFGISEIGSSWEMELRPHGQTALWLSDVLCKPCFFISIPRETNFYSELHHAFDPRAVGFPSEDEFTSFYMTKDGQLVNKAPVRTVRTQNDWLVL